MWLAPLVITLKGGIVNYLVPLKEAVSICSQLHYSLNLCHEIGGIWNAQ